MQPAKVMLRRCAIYTRKSSEEGLEQEFNSLHAQREACEAFIKSQAGEGWRLLKNAYDDGGLSGATMERPALLRLLGDIRQGLIEIVVVYKVDWLTRSLADFAKMVELFDAHHVSFVAVTQQFNTTTSIGRLTLNILLSFAQFEREVTGERIRDKIAASRRKGLWMGGVVPLGYALREHRLIINPAEAELVRRIYRRYLKLGSVRLVKAELDRYQKVSTRPNSSKGTPPHGHPFSRGALYLLLSNPLYVGEIRHRGARYPGQQPAIIERGLWESVQRQLQQHAVARHHRIAKVETSPLAGKLLDSSGERLTPSHTLKGDLRYRVSARLPKGPGQQVANGWRLPARELERTVAAVAQQLLADEPAIASAVEEVGIAASNLPLALQTAREWSGKLQSKDGTAAALRALVDRVELRRDGVRLSLMLRVRTAENEGGQSHADAVITRFFPLQVRRRGVELRLVLSDARMQAPSVDLVLLKALARARRWFEELAAGRAASISEIARREGVHVRYVGRLIRLAFLAPEIVESIATGRQPAGLTAESLIRRTRLCADWEGQKRALGFAATSTR